MAVRLVFLLLLAVSAALALKCYHCDSTVPGPDGEPECGEYESFGRVKECNTSWEDGWMATCTVVIGTDYPKPLYQSYVARGCAAYGYLGSCIMNYETLKPVFRDAQIDRETVECKTCTTDMCNQEWA